MKTCASKSAIKRLNINQENKSVCKPSVWKRINIQRLLQQSTSEKKKSQTTPLQNWQRSSIDISPRKLCKWLLTHERCSTCLVKCKLKPQWRNASQPVRWLLIKTKKKTENNKCWWRCRQTRTLLYCCWECEVVQLISFGIVKNIPVIKEYCMISLTWGT